MGRYRRPIFAGKTDEGEEIVLYVDEPDPMKEMGVMLTAPSKRMPPRTDYFIERPDGEIWALSPGSTMMTWVDEDWFGKTFYVKIDSPEWSGTAKGTREDLIRAEGMHL